jgi:hypothetical protein
VTSFHVVLGGLDDSDFHDGHNDYGVGCDFGVHDGLSVCNVNVVCDGHNVMTMMTLMIQMCVWCP